MYTSMCHVHKLYNQIVQIQLHQKLIHINFMYYMYLIHNMYYVIMSCILSDKCRAARVIKPEKSNIYLDWTHTVSVYRLIVVTDIILSWFP